MGRFSVRIRDKIAKSDKRGIEDKYHASPAVFSGVRYNESARYAGRAETSKMSPLRAGLERVGQAVYAQSGLERDIAVIRRTLATLGLVRTYPSSKLVRFDYINRRTGILEYRHVRVSGREMEEFIRDPHRYGENFQYEDRSDILKNNEVIGFEILG